MSARDADTTDADLSAHYEGRLSLADLPPSPIPNTMPMKNCFDGGVVRISRETMEVFADGTTERSTASIDLQHGDAIDKRCIALIAQAAREDRRYEVDACWARGDA